MNVSFPGKAAGRRCAGFTLVELLVVVGIIVLLAALIVPAFNSIGRSQSLTTAASIVSDSLALARQTALAQNRMVEVRFYRLPDESGGNLRFRALRLVQYDETGANAKPLGKLQRLPGGVVLAGEPDYSTLLSGANPSPPGDSDTDPQVNGASYKAVIFTPSGASPLDLGDRWFVSVQLEHAAPAAGKPADNFVTLQLDPINGRVRSHRP